MRRVGLSVVAVLAALCVPIPAFALVVPGTSDPWLAGMPNGTFASAPFPDQAPLHSPVLVPGLSLGSGGFLTFGAAGLVTNGPCCALVGPDGAAAFNFHAAGAEHGISNLNAPTNALVGVFLDASQPDSSGPPGTLDFQSLGLGFADFAPDLKQVFFIGDGLTGTGTGAVQHFVIPMGATRLFLGTMDGFEWNNNSGSFEVVVTQQAPEPSTCALLLASVGMLGAFARRRLRRILVQSPDANPALSSCLVPAESLGRLVPAAGA